MAARGFTTATIKVAGVARGLDEWLPPGRGGRPPGSRTYKASRSTKQCPSSGASSRTAELVGTHRADRLAGLARIRRRSASLMADESVTGHVAVASSGGADSAKLTS